MSVYQVEIWICGFHVRIPEGLDAKHQLVCVHEQSNRGDPFSVAIRKVAETRHVHAVHDVVRLSVLPEAV